MIILTNKQEIILNKYSFFPQNMELDAAIIGSIYPAEKRFLKSLLGDDLYNEMISLGSGVISDYVTTPNVEKFPANANYEKLWANYLLQFMSIAIMHESLPFIAAQIQTNGIVQQNPYGATGLTIKDSQTLQLQHRDTIFNLWYEIEKFLCENKKDYPLFKPKNCIRYNCKDCFDSNINFFEYLLHGRHRHRVRVKKGVVFYGRSPHFGRFRH